MSRKSNYSVHHNIPITYKDEFIHPEEANDRRNKTLVKDKRHIHHHAINNADTPAMQMMRDVEFNMKVLKKEFIKDLIEVFEKHVGNYYIFETRIQEEIGRLFELEDAFNRKK